MTSEKAITNSGMMRDDKMENVELHNITSITDGHVEILEKPKTEKSNEGNNSTTTHIARKTRFFLSEVKNMKVEVIMFLYIFSYILRSVTTTTMIMQKVCILNLNYSVEICEDLANNTDVKTAVSKLANNYMLGHSLIQMVPAAVLCLFIGSWSDTYSRKMPLMAALSGIILDGLGTTLCAYFFDSRVEFIFIPAIFSGLSGGFICVFLVLYSYVSDISTPSNRTMKFALLEVSFSIAMPLGSLAGGWIFKFYKYVPVFLTSTCGHVAGLIWVIFVLRETRGLEIKDSLMVKLRAFWSLKSVKSSYYATIKKRPNKGRAQIWLLIVGMSIAVFTFTATGGITYLYVHQLYDWDNTTFSTVNAVFSANSMVLMLIIVPISRKLRIAEPFLGIAGTAALIMKNICYGLAKWEGIFYLGNLLGLISGLCTLAGRSRISKVVSKEDLGKVFAFLSMAESLMPIASTAVASQVFNASLEVFPGLIFIMMGVLLFIPLAVYIWMVFLPKVDYEANTSSSEIDSTDAEGKSTQMQVGKLCGKH